MASDNALRKDICNVEAFRGLTGKIGKAIVACHIPPDLDYACLYWVFHFQQSERRIIDGGEVCIFLYTHFLHWLESLSHLRKLSDGVSSIRELLKIIQVC
jgi:hypothetical protein